MADDILKGASEDELREALVFTRNFKKPGNGLESVSETVRAHSCNANCDCYIEIEIAQAAGIGGYRYGS
jgi:putative bacteriocin precursor